MDAKPIRKPRPYWHVDAKWMTGLLLTFVLGLTLLVFSLVQVTEEKTAVDTLSMTLAILYSPQGLDDETGIAELRKQLRASPDGSIRPIPGLRIVVREQDIANLTPREARLFFFRQWAEPLYQQGAQGLMALADSPEIKAGLAQGIGLLMVFTRATHQLAQSALIVLGILSFVLLIPLMVFSYRFGRLSSPGCVLMVVSLPCAILFFIGSTLPRRASSSGAESGASGMLGDLVANVVPPLARITAQNYVIALLVGLGLVVLSVIGSLIWRLARRGRST